MKHYFGFQSNDSYTLTVQKQSGILDRTTKVTIPLPEYLETIWSTTDADTLEFSNAPDVFFAMLFETNL